jgi:hypothetical protein
MEQLNYNLLFRWFVWLSADDPVWDATVFCKNRDRLLNGDIARKFMISVCPPKGQNLRRTTHTRHDLFCEGVSPKKSLVKIGEWPGQAWP